MVVGMCVLCDCVYVCMCACENDSWLCCTGIVNVGA